jgi:hypothetical protein
MTQINETALRDAAHPAADAAAKPLVLTGLITAAQEAFKTAQRFEVAAIEAMAKAEDEQVKATEASHAASVTPGSDVYAAEVALEYAERRARVAKRVTAGSLANREAAREAVMFATREAHKPVVAEGARRMVSACKAIEDAQAALHAAFVEYRTGERMVALSAQAGGQGGGSVQWLVDMAHEICAPTAAVELAKWVRLGVLESAKVEG